MTENPAIRPMQAADYDAFYELLQTTPGVTVRDADSRDATERYLVRNPGLSFAAFDRGRLVGCALCGHDGRRGYLQHVIVAPGWRRRGLGRALVERCLRGLEAQGIRKTHIDVLKSNGEGLRYWLDGGWELREDIYRLSMNRGAGENT
ncbi:GNAT family N-acetyltransferase [Pigmentiphaga soli]|uniref:GNAT family N-acetyltransferase n=1 Tax=Pigmentiphaga soli TaxID=1007095 RepID=A0ABP8GDZ8_9BURK